MMPNNSNSLPVPYEESKERPKPVMASPLLAEVRVRSPHEIKRGRSLLIWICLFLTVLALAAPTTDLAAMHLAILPMHVARLLVSLMLVVCLFRAIPKVRFFAAIILAAGAAIYFASFVWGLATQDLGTMISSGISVIGYGASSLILALSPSIRGYLGYRRAERRHLRETQERDYLHRIVAYQAEKAQSDREKS